MDDKTLESHQFHLQRYSVLTQMWQHQNAVRLQWPAAIMAASLLVLSFVKLSKNLKPTKWGVDNDTIFDVGLPLLLTGIAILLMLYIMLRATINMNNLINEIHRIEGRYGVLTDFRTLNHQKGISGPLLMGFFAALAIGYPMTCVGCLLTFGLIYGIYIFIGIFIATVVLSCLVYCPDEQHLNG